MAFTPQMGGGGLQDMAGSLLQARLNAFPTDPALDPSQGVPQIQREMMTPVPMDTFGADRAQAAYDAFSPNPDTNGEGFLPLGNLGQAMGDQLGSEVEQAVAQTLVQSAMNGELDLTALLRAIQQMTVPQGQDPVGYQNPEAAFNYQYQSAMPGVTQQTLGSWPY
jgi:hypothetical protein